MHHGRNRITWWELNPGPEPCRCLPQGLFRNFSDAFMPVLRPHMERLVADSHESKQRCVAEIISGLIRGSKHWSYVKVSLLSA